MKGPEGFFDIKKIDGRKSCDTVPFIIGGRGKDMYGQMHDVEFVFKDVHGKIIGELQPKIYDLLTEKRPKIWLSGISSLLCHQNSYNS
jgi:hypothetical protein